MSCLVLSLTGIGAAPSTQAICIPLLMDCSTPAPTPSPTPGGSGGSGGSGGATGGLGGVVGGLLGGGSSASSGGAASATKSKPDRNAPTFTLPAAQLGGSSLSITGLKSVTLVTVPLADGSRTPVIRMEADDVAIDDFVLDVRRATGPTAVTNATRMELRGNVVVYIDSLSATLANGLGISLLADTPLPGDELPHTLLRPTLGLVGVTANSITFTNNDLFVSGPVS